MKYVSVPNGILMRLPKWLLVVGMVLLSFGINSLCYNSIDLSSKTITELYFFISRITLYLAVAPFQKVSIAFPISKDDF
jgi:hypothetical protein